MGSTFHTWELELLLPLITLLTGLQAVACGVWALSLARVRGHSGTKWFWIGFFLSAAGVIWARKLSVFFASPDADWHVSCLPSIVNRIFSELLIHPNSEV